jgi:hypothetical protein
MLRLSHKIGIDANRPVITEGPHRGAAAPTVADPDLIAATGAGWVRINFVLGPWASPNDTTVHQGRDWEGLYRTIILGFRQKGLNIYGLIGHEAVHADPGDRFRSPPEQMSADARRQADEWIQQYVATFATIVRMFHDQVKVFESFNEPDDWHAADRNWVHPAWFAHMLHAIYTAVKGDPHIQQTKIISGPLQGLELNRNAAADYVRATYQEGIQRFGWGDRAPFPLDGVGYHVYIKEALNDDWPAQERAVRQMYQDYVNGIRQVVREAEGRDRPLYISECGWFSNRGGEAFQADNMRLGLRLLADDPTVDLGIWFCTQDFGGDADNKYYGLYRREGLGPAHRKPAYHVFRTLCESHVEAPSIRFENQTMINAFFYAARELGQDGWQMILRAGLEHLAFARHEPYTGQDIEELPGLTDEERAAIRRQLHELVPELRRRTGTTTVHVNLRSGPSTQHTVLTVLPPLTSVEVLEEQGEWLHVATLGKVGYLHRSCVALDEQSVIPGFLRPQAEFAGVPLPPPQSEVIPLDPAVMDDTALALARTWNRYGGLLAVLSNALRIDAGLAAAVFVVEAGGRGFAADGRMIIRFENHIFFDSWGRQDPDRFAQHFRFSPDRRWQDHQWRRSPDEAWRSFHGDQSAEWEVFQFAQTIDETAAKLSISMGAPQIMGFNHSTIGYESVHQMFDDFAESESGERAQILAFFDFVKGTSVSSPRIRALQDGDFHTFAALYNGAGQAARYGSLISSRFDLFRRLRAGELPTPRWEPPDIAPPVGEARPRLPLPGAGEPSRPLSEVDPELYEYWRAHIREGFERNSEMFRRVLDGFMRPYHSTIWMYRILFAVGIVSFVAATALSIWTRSAAFSWAFTGLSAVAFVGYFLSRPLRSLEENLEFITWLGLVYNTYWTRLAYMRDERTVQEDLADATREATDQIERLIEKHAALASRRPGPGERVYGQRAPRQQEP